MGMMIESLSSFRKERLVTIETSFLVMDAQELARRNGIHHLPILRDGRLVGLICTCDMLVCPGDVRVEAIMKTPVSLALDSSVEAAARLMAERAVGSVLLTEADQPVGIVTRGDIFEKAENVAASALLSACECCGVRSHLRRDEDGRTYCVFCKNQRLTTRDRVERTLEGVTDERREWM